MGTVFVFVSILLLYYFYLSILAKNTSYDRVAIQIGTGHISAKIANTEDQRQKGLMYVTNLPENEGMVFLFDREGYYGFWMKNMHVPLDMIWVDSKEKVVDITPNATVCVRDSCPFYKPRTKASTVIEVNAGWAAKNNVKIGDQVDILQNPRAGY